MSNDIYSGSMKIIVIERSELKSRHFIARTIPMNPDNRLVTGTDVIIQSWLSRAFGPIEMHSNEILDELKSARIRELNAEIKHLQDCIREISSLSLK